MIRFARHPLLVLVVVAAVPSIAVAGDPSGKDPATDRPETPSVEAVVAAMNSVTPAVRACGNGWRGLVPTRFVFEGATGATTSVSVDSDVPRQVGRCAEQAAAAARLPPFRQAQYSVNYPFRI